LEKMASDHLPLIAEVKMTAKLFKVSEAWSFVRFYDMMV
jgi:hypothetical protein